MASAGPCCNQSNPIGARCWMHQRLQAAAHSIHTAVFHMIKGKEGLQTGNFGQRIIR